MELKKRVFGSGWISIVVGMTMMLAACGSNYANDQRICTEPGTSYLNPPTKRSQRSSTEQMIINEDCIHAWSYRLGRAPGVNGEIADAVIEACDFGIIYEANMRIEEQTEQKATRQSESAISDELRRQYVRTALFHVVQGRAGRCDIP